MIARRLAAPVIALMLANGAAVHGEDPPRPALLEPRVVSASIEGIWLDQAEVSLQMAVRSGRDLTIRSISFTDAFVGNIPVWIASVEGDWPLRPGQEVEIPAPIRVTAMRSMRSAPMIWRTSSVKERSRFEPPSKWRLPRRGRHGC